MTDYEKDARKKLDDYGRKYLADHLELAEMDLGPDVDVLLAQHVMGWHRISGDIPMRTQIKYGGYIYDELAYILRRGSIGELWRPRINIIDAWDAIEKLTTDEDREHPLFFKCTYNWWPASKNELAAYAAFDWKMTGDRNPLYQAKAKTMPYAISLAALKVVFD